MDGCILAMGVQKLMIWKNTKCSIICRNQKEVEDDRWRFYIGGLVVGKGLDTTYLGLTLSSKGICDNRKITRG